MKDIEQAKRLFSMAKKDVIALRRMVGDEAFADEILGFHAQQAVEKSLKAWLSCLGVAYPKTHDLLEIMEALRSQGEAIPEEIASLEELVDFAVQYRYEGYDDEMGLDRQETYRRVSLCMEHVAIQLAQSETLGSR